MQLNEGILTLRPKEGKLIRDTEVFGQMSPYITFTFGNKKYKTKVHDNGGKKPKWSDEFTIEVSNASEEIVMRVWDQDLTTSDAVGFAKIKMSSLIINCGVEDWFTIMYENQKAGDILISTTFEPKGGNAYNEMESKLAAQEDLLAKQQAEAKQAMVQMAQHQQELNQRLAQQQQNLAAQQRALDQAHAQQQQKESMTQ